MTRSSSTASECMAEPVGDQSPRAQGLFDAVRVAGHVGVIASVLMWVEGALRRTKKTSSSSSTLYSATAGRLPGRSGDEVKNYWNSHLRKKLRSMGVDPDNHRVTQNVLLRRSQTSHSATLSSTDDATNERVECCWCFNPATEGHRACYADGRPEENCNGGLPDLNLDLTISLPSSLVEKRRGSEDSTDPARLDNPTLLLFP
ncbi:hypothetical protein OPV22_019837 [Ensete ventricosum]|uniref:HTH myb-type domain-containing protein n=1 Tax=Ensete ventricosum TaxID=4639 RepID=A0AAV8QLP2_ENSVE|nr:hypothetical protein OPV22_019837 [Ensete ventricosum]